MTGKPASDMESRGFEAAGKPRATESVETHTLQEAAEKLAAEEARVKLGVLTDLGNHVPWEAIAEKWHISSKRIAEIKAEALAISKQPQAKHPYEEHGDLGPRWSRCTEGQIQSACFKMFEDDKKPYAVTRDLELPQPLVQEIFQQFLQGAGHQTPYCKLCYSQGETEGRKLAGRDSYLIRYPCKNCLEPMVFDPSNPTDRKNLIRLLKDGGIQLWAHTKCLKEKDQVEE